MLLRALVEVWPGEVAAFVHELPGVIVSAPSLDELLEALPNSVEAHLGWLAAHGFDTDSFAGAEIEVAEQLDAVEGKRGPLFEADREIATPDQIDAALQIAALARRDLVDLYRSISEFRRELVRSEGQWSVAYHLQHVAEAEVFYASRLGQEEPEPLPSDPVEALRASAAYATNVLTTLPESARAQVFERRGEQWTATKVLRRMTSHLREHYPWVRELAHG